MLVHPHSRCVRPHFDVIFVCIQCLLAFISSQHRHPHRPSLTKSESRKVVLRHLKKIQTCVPSWILPGSLFGVAKMELVFLSPNFGLDIPLDKTWHLPRFLTRLDRWWQIYDQFLELQHSLSGLICGETWQYMHS